MNIAYFFSGFDPVAGFTNEIANHLKKDIINRDLMLFIASNPTGYEKSERYVNVNKNWFEHAGISFNEYRLLDDRVDILL